MPQLLQRFCRKEFGAVSGRMAERFQEAGRSKNRNLVRLKTEEPRRLKCTQPCW